VAIFANLYGVSPTTVYRALKNFQKPRLVRRADHGKTRVSKYSAEIKALFANQLDPTRTAELRAELQIAGLPI
jgi:Fe2+ or Zn2+ uptake regulation protein